MYSKVLVAWRSEHRKWIRNAGAPDHAGIRSESRADSARQPVGFFQVRLQPLEPPVARDSESTRLAILAGVRYMIDHAPTREAVILRIMLESGARVSEVLALTARGLRMAHNPKIGIDVAAFVRNKGQHTLAKPIWCSADTREQLRRYIAHERSQVDQQRRTRLEQLDDDDPIFLSRRKRQLEYSGFGIVFKHLLGNAQRHFGSAPQQPDAIRPLLPGITPHTIRHLHTTFRVKKVRELFASPAERERALAALVDDLGWRSAEMLKTYDHAITRSELRELMASSVRQMSRNGTENRWTACLSTCTRRSISYLTWTKSRGSKKGWPRKAGLVTAAGFAFNAPLVLKARAWVTFGRAIMPHDASGAQSRD